jgi:hypothetical protein
MAAEVVLAVAATSVAVAVSVVIPAVALAQRRLSPVEAHVSAA